MGIVQSSYNSSNVGAPTFLLLFLSQNFVGVMNIKVKVKIWGLPLILILSPPSCRVLLGYFQTKQGPFACVRLDVRKLVDLDPISSFQKLSRCYLRQEGLPPSLPPSSTKSCSFISFLSPHKRIRSEGAPELPRIKTWALRAV